MQRGLMHDVHRAAAVCFGAPSPDQNQIQRDCTDDAASTSMSMTAALNALSGIMDSNAASLPQYERQCAAIALTVDGSAAC